MLMVAIVVLGLVVVPLVGGSLRRLGDIRIRRGWLIFVGLALQIVVTTIFPDLPPTPSKVVHLGSYAFVLGFLFSNRLLPGVKLVLLGTVLNFAAIVANGGTMPARPAALAAAGIVSDHAFENSAPVRDANLQYLGDIFAVPSSVPLSNVFSVGDVLIDAGALVLVMQTCRRPSAIADVAEDSAPELSYRE